MLPNTIDKHDNMYRVRFYIHDEIGDDCHYEEMALLVDMLGIKKNIYIEMRQVEHENAPSVVKKYLKTHKCDFAKSITHPLYNFCIRFEEVDSNEELMDYFNLIEFDALYFAATDNLCWNDYIFSGEHLFTNELISNDLAKFKWIITDEMDGELTFNLKYFSKEEVNQIIEDWKNKINLDVSFNYQ